MNAVGIDVSKGKSTVTIRRPGDMVLMPPCGIPHTQSAINATTIYLWLIPLTASKELPILLLKLLE